MDTETNGAEVAAVKETNSTIAADTNLARISQAEISDKENRQYGNRSLRDKDNIPRRSYPSNIGSNVAAHDAEARMANRPTLVVERQFNARLVNNGPGSMHVSSDETV